MHLEATVVKMEHTTDDPSRPIALTIEFADKQTLTTAITRAEARGLYPGMQVNLRIQKVWGNK